MVGWLGESEGLRYLCIFLFGKEHRICVGITCLWLGGWAGYAGGRQLYIIVGWKRLRSGVHGKFKCEKKNIYLDLHKAGRLSRSIGPISLRLGRIDAGKIYWFGKIELKSSC